VQCLGTFRSSALVQGARRGARKHIVVHVKNYPMCFREAAQPGKVSRIDIDLLLVGSVTVEQCGDHVPDMDVSPGMCTSPSHRISYGN
jgi:hypothetical protein